MMDPATKTMPDAPMSTKLMMKPPAPKRGPTATMEGTTQMVMVVGKVVMKGTDTATRQGLVAKVHQN